MSVVPESAANFSRPNRSLTPRLEKLTAAYAAVASATAAVALLAAPEAQAEIVYTPTNKTVSFPVNVDLNHDGIADFTLQFCQCLPHGDILQVALGVTGNKVRAFERVEAAALQRNAPIGPKQSFTSATSGYYGVFMAVSGAYGSITYVNGPWVNVTNRYLGLKFLIGGQVHYGWARISTDHQVVLTGYAYETTPNKHIRAGQTAEDAAEVKTSSSGPALGMLAQGVEGMPLWRRE
jgi:hypothetical protein